MCFKIRMCTDEDGHILAQELDSDLLLATMYYRQVFDNS